MNGGEDEASNTVLPGSPPPPPYSDFLFPTILHIPKFDSDIENENSFEEAVRRVISVERCFHPRPFYEVYTHIQSQLQQGPKCGLVALSMATSMTENFKSADELFDEAVKRGFTTHGEMFSAENLATLAESSTKFKKLVLDSGIDSHVDCIFHCIQNGGLMLVPYDADYNHRPCCRRGHNAHWAIMSGLVILKLKDSEEEVENDCVPSEEDVSIMTNPGFYPQCQCLNTDSGNFFNTRPNTMKILRRASNIYFTRDDENLQNAKKCKLYLVGKQGKSKHMALWPFEALAESNDNLTELSEWHRDKNFTLPIGGISSGLKGKAILLHQKH